MNKYSKYAVAAAVAAIVGLGTQAGAMTIGWSDLAGPAYLTYSDGVTPLAQGVPIFLGSDTKGTLAGFTTYDSGLIGDGTSTEGTFSEAGSGATGVGFFTLQMYVEVGAAGLGGAFLETNPNWKFPADDTGDVSIDLSDSGLSIIVGSYSTGTVSDSNLTGGGDNPNVDALVTSLVAVPEPSSIMLVVVGLLGGMTLLRRRS
jgi:hypothetical protein